MKTLDEIAEGAGYNVGRYIANTEEPRLAGIVDCIKTELAPLQELLEDVEKIEVSVDEYPMGIIKQINELRSRAKALLGKEQADEKKNISD